MRLELTQDRGHVHVALAAVVAIEALESGVLGLVLAGRETVIYVRADEQRLVTEWQRVKSIPMPLMLPKPEAQPARPVRPRRVVLVEADS
jgi:site-specific recombinase